MTAFRNVFAFIKPYWKIAALGVLTVILPVAMELVGPRAIQLIIDQGITPGDMEMITFGGAIMVGAAIISAIATIGQGYCRATVSQGMAYDLRNALFTKIMSFSFANLDVLQTGELMTRISSDVDRVRMLAGTGKDLMIRALTMLIGGVIMLFVTDAELALIMFILVPAAFLIFQVFIRRAIPLFSVIQEKLSALNTAAQENLSGVEVVKAFVRERFEIDKFEARNTDYTDMAVRVGKLAAVVFPLVSLVTNIGMLAVIGFGGMKVIGDRMTVGQLIAFTNYLATSMAPLIMLGMLIQHLASASASAERLDEVLRTEPEVKDSGAARQPETIRGAVAFEDVTFHYDGDDGGGENVLQDVSFSVHPGERVAILGATGSGKTTLVNLIARFYDPVDGRVLIDGTDARDLKQRALRDRIGTVMQQPILFSGTVRGNIAYGEPEAPESDVIKAAEAAQAHPFVSDMEGGYDARVEPRGANLSGGQKQRLAIARALLSNPSILILDDSTSAVDMETEFKIQEALDEVMDGRTTFIIAQRISSVLSADRIMVLERGHIEAMGTHAELLEISPIYREIYESQLKDDRLAAAD